jgi:hypothetical protein
MHCPRAMPKCFLVASAGGAESIILSAGGTESMMLSAPVSSCYYAMLTAVAK